MIIPLFEQYQNELKELNLPYSFDLNPILEGDIVYDITGDEYIVSSTNNDSNGNGFVVNLVNEDDETVTLPAEEVISKKERQLFWYDAIKAIIAMDIIKMGGNFSGGGVIASGGIYNKWRGKINSKLEKIRQEEDYKEIRSECFRVSDILNSDKYLLDINKELERYPYSDVKFISSFIGKNAKKKLEENREMRKQLIGEIGEYIINTFPNELIFIKKLLSLIK